MYNFSLGMLFAIAAMGYTYIFVPDSRPIRDKLIAKMKAIEDEKNGKEMMTLDRPSNQKAHDHDLNGKKYSNKFKALARSPKLRLLSRARSIQKNEIAIPIVKCKRWPIAIANSWSPILKPQKYTLDSRRILES